jgi:hypothetical protein
MKLILQIPAELASTLSCSALESLPDDVPAWVARVMHENLPSRATLEMGGLIEQHTETGWRFRIADARVVVDREVVEVRVAAFYRFFEHVGSALARFSSIDHTPALAREVIASFATARPDFSSRLVGLPRLWDTEGCQ